MAGIVNIIGVTQWVKQSAKHWLGKRKRLQLDTFGGRIHVEWDTAVAVTPLGLLPFFIDFLKVSGLFDGWVADCPLGYRSNNASDKRAVLVTSTKHPILALAQLYRDRADWPAS